MLYLDESPRKKIIPLYNIVDGFSKKNNRLMLCDIIIIGEGA